MILEKIKMFEQKNKNNQTLTGNKPRKSKNNFETPIKTENKKDFQSTEKIKNSNSLEIDYLAKEIHENKFICNSVNDDKNSYVRQSLKRKTIRSNNKDKDNNNISIISNNNLRKSKITHNTHNNNKSVEKSNFIYKNFVKNLKLEIKNNEEIDKNENVKKNKKKKKNILGNFLNQFVNKAPNNDESKNKQILASDNNINIKNNNNFKNINKIYNINFYIESTKKQNNNINGNNDNNEIIRMKKELELKDNKIKQLLKSVENLNNLIQENEKLKSEIVQLKNIIKHSENSNNVKQSDINKNEINIDKNKYNNLITYNINKNNNYNIINSHINHFDNLNVNQNNKDDQQLLNNSKEPKNDKEKDKDIEKDKLNKSEIEKAKKVTKAFERFKRANRSIDLSNKDKDNILKSDKISIIAKMLEGHLGNNENKKYR